MTEAGQNFENFRIAGDIDLSKYVTNGKIPMGLKINSLVGETKSDGGKYTITFGGKGVQHSECCGIHDQRDRRGDEESALR